MTFGTNLKKYRESKGFTQKQVAKALGITEQAYQRYELGTREPSFSMMNKIGEVLNIAPVYFFTFPGTDPAHFKHDTPFPERFKKEIESYCKEFNFTEDIFFNILEIMDRDRYENIKAGLAEPKLFELIRIAQVLQVSTDYLLGLE